MSVTPSHLRNLIDDGEIKISPFDAGSLVGNTYTLHLASQLFYYDAEFDYNLASVPGEKLSDENKDFTQKYGYALDPGRTAYIYMKEKIDCKRYDVDIVAHENFSRHGLILLDHSFDGNTVRLEITANRSLLMKPGDGIAKIRFGENDESTMAVPIGGIIGWSGSKIPYGYTLCNGSNGSPNLVNKFIMGSTSTGDGGGQVTAGLGYSYYKLAFIMRIK